MDAKPRPESTTSEELAQLLDLPLLQPELTSEKVHEGLALAKRLGIGCVTVRPCDIELAVRALDSTAIQPAAAAGFPHGSSSTAVKLYEVRDLLRRGARVVEMVIAISKLVSREFPYVQTELLQASEACHKEGAQLKVTLESGLLTDEMKIVACRCADKAEVDVVKTATGFGPSGSLGDVPLLRKYLPQETGIEVVGDAFTLEQLLELHGAGCTLFGTSGAAAILEEWKTRNQTPEGA